MFMKTPIKRQKGKQTRNKGREPYVEGRATNKNGKARRFVILP
jgi:hypothetical protein